MTMTKLTSLMYVCLLTASAAADCFEVPASAWNTPAQLAEAMPILASQFIPQYRETNRSDYLDSLFRLQLVANSYADAARTLAGLRALRAGDSSPETAAKDLQYAIFLRAKALETTGPVAFDIAFGHAFRETLATLDDQTSALLIRAMSHYSAGIS